MVVVVVVELVDFLVDFEVLFLFELEFFEFFEFFVDLLVEDLLVWFLDFLFDLWLLVW